MIRRDVLIGLGLAVGAILLGRDTSAAAKGHAVKKNVLFIAVDDLNDWVGCFGGHLQAKTPNMEWTNLADRPELEAVKKRLAKWMPTYDAEDSPVNKIDKKLLRRTGEVEYLPGKKPRR